MSTAKAATTKAEGGGAVTGQRTWTTVPPASLVKETFQTHFVGGKPTAERQAKVHDPILKEALANVRPVAPGAKKIAIMTMGGPGSGKSSAIANEKKSGNFVSVDPDEIRTKLPEWKDATRKGATYMGASAKTHEEASYIAKEMQKQAIEQGKNVNIDGTGGNTKNYVDKIKALKDAGYEVHVAFTHTPEGEGVKRAEKRAEGAGRMVPRETAAKTYAALPKTLAAARKLATSLSVFDNTPAGGRPRLVFSSRGGKDTAHEELGNRIMKESERHAT